MAKSRTRLIPDRGPKPDPVKFEHVRKAAAFLKTFNDRAEALAKRGDFQLLIVNARLGRLTKSQQRLVADILVGDLRPRKGNPASIVQTGDRRMEIGNCVLDLERRGMQTSAAVSKTADVRKLPQSTVWGARKFAIGYYRAERLVLEQLSKSTPTK
jgi:hypothetical protein